MPYFYDVAVGHGPHGYHGLKVSGRFPWWAGTASILCFGGCDAPTCRELCEEEQSCADTADPDPKGCGSDCERIDGLNEASGCSGAYEELLDCVQDAGVCEVDEATCRAVQSTWFDCTSDYCDRNRSAEPCQSARR